MQLIYLFLLLLLACSSSYAQQTPSEIRSGRITDSTLNFLNQNPKGGNDISKAYTRKIRWLREQIASIRKELKKKTTELAAGNIDIKRKEKLIAELDAKTKTLEKRVTDLQKEVSDLEEINNEMKKEIEEAKEQIEEAEKQVNALYTEIDQTLAFKIVASVNVYQKGRVIKQKTLLTVELKENEKQEIRYASLQEVRIETSPLFNKLGKPLKYDLKYSDNGQEKSVIEGKKLMPGEQEISILQNKNFDFKKFRKKVFTLTVYYEENLQPNKIYITRTFSWD